MAKNDKIAGGILLVFFTIACYMASKFPEKSGYFPLFVCGAGILLSAILLISAFVRGRKKTDEPYEKLSKDAIGMIVFMSAAILIYAIGMQYIGFAVSTFVFMIVTSIKLYPQKITAENKRPMIIILVTALVVTALIYIIFKQLLYVPLPSGLLI